MSFISIDNIIFGIFLAVNLFVGLRASRRVKTLRDFSIGNKDFSTATVTSTIVATWIGGGFIFYALQNIYASGLQFILALLGGSICLLFMGQVLAIRMGEFLNNLSIAEAIGNLYGKTARIITAFSGIIRTVGGIAIQFQVIAKMLTLLLGFKGPWVTIAAASIVIFYSAFGGIRSVTFTDIVQFVTFSVFIPILALLIWNNMRSPQNVVQLLHESPLFSWQKAFAWNAQTLSMLGVMLYFIIPGMNPAIFQRIAMAKDVWQVRDSFTYSAGIHVLIMLSTAWIAILLLADPTVTNPTDLLNHIITQYAYPGLKSLIAVGIVAMAMSTADSDMNATAVLVANDILKPFALSTKEKESITSARLACICLGICSLVLALSMQNLLNLLLFSSSFYMPIVTVPFLLAVFGFRSTPRAVIIGMLAGFITVIVWSIVFGNKSSIIPGILANVLFLIGSHYILKEKGGWIGIKVPGPLIAARQRRRDSWRNFINKIKNTNIYDYLQQNLPAYEVIYTLFAIYVIGATYVFFYTIPDHVVTRYATIYNFIYHSVLICTAAFLTYPAWPPTFKSKRFITFAWPIGIFYTLFVVGSIIVLMSGFHEVQVMIFLLNLIIAAFLLSWPLMLFLSTLGTIVGYLVFNMYCGDIYHCRGIAETSQFKLTYSILLVSSFLIALFRFKQEKKVLRKRNIYLEHLYEEKNNELAQLLAYREEVLKELNADEKALLDQTTAAYLQQIIYRMTDYMRLEVTQISLDQLLLEVKETLKLTDLTSVPQLLTTINTKQENINADIVKLKQLLVNGILYIHKHNSANEPINIVIEDAKLGHKIDYIKDYTREIKALKFTITIEKLSSKKKDIYMLEQLPLMSQHTKKGKLIENARIIHAHYGYAELENEHTQVYILPVNVREVRGKVMELLREPAVADPEELKHPLAIQLEKELVDKVKNLKMDTKVISKALDTIKRYHAGVKRKSGEPFFTHPIQVALILLGYCKDQDAVVAALLHDTVEDTSLSLIQIKTLFGEQVAFIVNKVTNLEDKLRRVSLQDHENVYRIMNYQDERAAYVKLADRLHNMRTISGHSALAKQKHIANETLNFFVPLAQKLNLTFIAQELEKLSLEVLGKKE